MSETASERLPAVAEPPREFIDVRSGERLPATVENAAAVIEAAREVKRKMDEVIRDAEGYLAEQSRVRGTKTFHTDWGKVTVTGGPATSYDPEKLREGLTAAGCPEDRINEVVTATVTYKVDQRILKQMAAANGDYAKAAEAAKIVTENPLRASLKR